MKLIAVILATLIGSLNATKVEDSVFVRNFNRLHGGPPPPPSSRSDPRVQTLWIEQKLDNFDETETRTWQMRYMSNDKFYKEGGPIFIFVGGEWFIDPGFITGGHMYDMAKEHNGYLFYTEHRYYGLSKPTADLSNENMKYLHVEQALADLAHFIKTMKSTIPGLTNSKVILVGGSYSATMVTWFKKLYPDVATGCWASSAPLFAKVDFVEYKEICGRSIRQLGGDACYKRIENGIAELESMFANKRGAEVKAVLKLCSNFDESSDLDIWSLFSEISELFAGLVQGHSNGAIQRECSRIMAGEDDLTGVASWILNTFGPTNEGCHDLSFKTFMEGLKYNAYGDNIMRQWIYQTCNEYGWYQTSGSRAQPFGTKFPVTLYTTMCADAYGEKFSNEFIHQQANRTNTKFGGLTPEVENVYITHGQLDPWQAMGILDEKQATIIPLHSHCSDFGSISSSDTPEMRASKERIAELVREWVAAPPTGENLTSNESSKLLNKMRNL